MRKKLTQLLDRPWVRVQLCGAAVASLLLLAGGAYATHRAKSYASYFGSEVLRTVGHAGGEAVVFNGARFSFSAQVVKKPLAEVVAQAKAACEQDTAEIARELAPSLARLPKLPGSEINANQLLMLDSSESSSVGEVGCWLGNKSGSRGLTDRIKQLAETGNLSDFGTLYFVRAEQYGEKTLVRQLWSDGPLSVDTMFPETGDTPGEDFADLPRPPGSMRILAAEIVGTERRVVGYDTAQSVAELNDFYAVELPKLGWKEVELNPEEAPQQRVQHAFERGDKRALLALTESERGTAATWVEIIPPSKK